MLPLLLAAHAQAFSTTGEAWSLDRMPIELHWTGDVEGMTHAEVAAAVEEAAAVWSAVLPCAVAFAVVEDPDAEAWWEAGGDLALVVGVPTGEDGDSITDVGTLVAVLGSPVAEGEGFGAFTPAARSTLLVAARDDWRSDAALRAGEEGLSLRTVVAHQLGHQLGLGHSCGEDVPCTEEHDAAVMAPLAETGPGRSALGADDVAGIEAIYGGLPLDHGCDAVGDLGVECAVTEAAADFAPRWTFPDGTAVDGTTAAHAFPEPGYHTVELCVDSPTCGERLCHGFTLRTNALAAGPGGGYDVPPPAAEAKGCDTAPGGSGLGGVVALGWLLGRRRRFALLG